MRLLGPEPLLSFSFFSTLSFASTAQSLAFLGIHSPIIPRGPYPPSSPSSFDPVPQVQIPHHARCLRCFLLLRDHNPTAVVCDVYRLISSTHYTPPPSRLHLTSCGSCDAIHFPHHLPSCHMTMIMTMIIIALISRRQIAHSPPTTWLLADGDTLSPHDGMYAYYWSRTI